MDVHIHNTNKSIQCDCYCSALRVAHYGGHNLAGKLQPFSNPSRVSDWFIDKNCWRAVFFFFFGFVGLDADRASLDLENPTCEVKICPKAKVTRFTYYIDHEIKCDKSRESCFIRIWYKKKYIFAYNDMYELRNSVTHRQAYNSFL